jgi:PAS domain S-box-containing protein
MVAMLAKLGGGVPTGWVRSLPVLPLQIYLILLALAVLVPALLFSGYLLTRFSAQDREQYEQRLRYAAQDLAQNIDRDLESIKTTLKTLAVSRPLAAGDFAEFHRQANDALGGSGLTILVLDRNLQQLVNTGVPFGTALPKSGDPETALKVLESKQPQVSDLFVGRLTRRPAVDVHMPMMRNGEVRYILIMSFTPERALSLLQALRLPKGWTTTLSDGKGKVIARSELHEQFVNTALPAKLLARRRDPTVFATTNLEGAPVLRAAAPLKQADWFAAVTVPMAMADASTRGSVKLAVASGIGLLLLSVAIAVGIGHLLATPITGLAETARALGEDAPVKAMNSPIKEVNQVSEALYFASVELEDRAFTNAKLAAIVRSSQDAIVAFGLDRRIQAWNAGAERMFGYSPKEALGQLYTMLVPSERRDEADQLASRVQAGEPMLSLETERVRKDGTVFPAHITISPVTASDGRLLAFSALLIDISARKAMEKQRDLLSHELLHRVKNTFAVVQAIARQTFKSSGQELPVFLGRLNALAATHDVLTESNWEGGELGALARNQLASYLAGPAPAIALSGPVVTLPREMAVPMGLVLHELATNAGKYGALSQPGGSIEVTWSVEGLENGTQVNLKWRERGGPNLDGDPKREGFGTLLIEQSLPEAQIERRFERDGFICTIMLMLHSKAESEADKPNLS